MNDFALLFPGQGAQHVGMGADLVENSAAARAVFDEANDELDMKLDRLCFAGPLAELSSSDVAQPAILTVSIATLRAMAEATGHDTAPAGVAGLSLGEYTALTAAGVLEFRQAVNLVRHRGLFMQEACEQNPGTMYSIIGLEDKQVEEACERAGESVWPANYNSPGQVVISGENQPAARAAELCTEMGARRTVELNVAGAFHTPLMQPAADRLEPLIRELEMKEPRVPVVANVTGRTAADTDEICDLLIRQVVNPVRWVDCQRWFLNRGVEQFYEVGPGRVLRGLLRRTARSVDCLSVGSYEDVETYAEDAG